MARPRFTTAAFQDLEEITRYIAARNPAAATRLIDRIEAECLHLSEQPGIGQLREDLLPGMRFFPLGNYLIFYRQSSEGIDVLRVLHGARNYGPESF